MEKPEFVYHYTTMDALKGILKKDKKGLVFWGTRYDSMNDPQDYLFSLRVVLPKMLHAIQGMEELDESQSEYVEEIPYIVSFTENKDDEFMWKHYKAEVALEINPSVFTPYLLNKGEKTISAYFGKCSYTNEEDIDKNFIDEWKKSDVYLDNLMAMTQKCCTFIKRDAFRRENEWRLFSSAVKLWNINANGEQIESENSCNPINVKCVKDRDIILYMEFEIPANALKGIIVNDVDVEHYHKVVSHLRVLLSQKGINPDTISIRQTSMYPLNI